MAALEKPVDLKKVVTRPVAVRPIDLVHLSRQSLGDTGLEGEILLMFDQMVSTYLSRIRETTDRELILFNLHALKGAAAGVGAVSVRQLAETAEQEMADGSPLSHERLADLRMAVEEVRQFIAEMLGD